MDPLRERGSGFYVRETAFSYTCRACSRCCYSKRIHVNPYEVAHLARALGTSTTTMLARYVEEGAWLANREDGACVLLGPKGCTVHADRPLVCRLYPLGRVVTGDGVELFFELLAHPQTEGEHGTSATVNDYLISQGVQSYFDAAVQYHEVLAAWLETWAPIDEREPEEVAPEIPWAVLDLDRAVAAYCASAGTSEPEALSERLALHVAMLRELGQGNRAHGAG